MYYNSRNIINIKLVDNIYLLQLLQNNMQILYILNITFIIKINYIKKQKKISYLILDTRIFKNCYKKQFKIKNI